MGFQRLLLVAASGVTFVNAFEKYLLSVSGDEAIGHVINCLYAGPMDNEAWQFLDRMLGDWSCPQGELRNLIYFAIKKLAQIETTTV